MNRRSLFVGGAVTMAVWMLASAGGHAYTTYASWAFSPVTYYVNPQNADVVAGAAEAALQSAASSWTTQSRAAFQFVHGGRVADTATGYDGRNVVLFRNATNGGAIATTYSWWDASRHLVDSDMVIWDGGFKFFTGTSGCVEAGIANSAYLEDVTTHEFGHMLGLQHSTLPTATMYPSYSWCSQEMRSLDADDVAGVEALYPATSSTNTAPSVSISSPLNGSSATTATFVAFTGSATDSQDGNLSASLAWTSNIDGALGTGASFTRTLSAGSHTITASVTDSRGLASSSNVSITVTATCGRANPTVTLTPSGPVSVAIGVMQSYNVKVTNNDSSTCGSSSFALRPTVVAGWTVTLNSSMLSINPGSTAQTSLKVTAPLTTLAGAYTVSVWATNVAASDFVGAGSAIENIFRALGVSVSTDKSTYAIDQTGYITVTVLEGAVPSSSAKVTIVMRRPDGSVFKQWTPTTNSTGVVKTNFKAALPTGAYKTDVTATKGGATGSATAQVSFQ